MSPSEVGIVAMRAGDIVKHRPSKETWLLAWADAERGEVCACGWPETIARMDDCTVVQPASDEAHLRTLREVAASGSGVRVSVARRQLAAVEAK